MNMMPPLILFLSSVTPTYEMFTRVLILSMFDLYLVSIDGSSSCDILW